MSGTDEPEGRASQREAVDDLERARENVLEGWPSVSPDDGYGELAAEPSDDESQDDASQDDRSQDDEPQDDEPQDDRLEVSSTETDAATALDDAHPTTAQATDDGAAAVVSEPDSLVETSSEHAPGELTVPPGYSVLEGEARGGRRAVGIVVSRFNGEVTGRLLTSALDELAAHEVGMDSITIMPVPGAFELPIAAMALAKTRRFACVVALGCVIRGDTPHFDYVASEAASGLQLAAIETGVPVAFGVLTLDRPDQAAPRFDKGAEAVRTALEMADLFANLRAAAAAR